MEKDDRSLAELLLLHNDNLAVALETKGHRVDSDVEEEVTLLSGTFPVTRILSYYLDSKDPGFKFEVQKIGEI